MNILKPIVNILTGISKHQMQEDFFRNHIAKRVIHLMYTLFMTIIQFPNTPFLVMAITWIICRVATGAIVTWALALFYAAGFVWAYLEFTEGVNRFRQFLGLSVGIYFIYSLASMLM